MRVETQLATVYGLGWLLLGLPVIAQAPIVRLLDADQVLVPGGTSSPEIEHAKSKYVERGNEYIWGANDCSRFVLDLWFAQGLETDIRLTTHSMANQQLMRSLGFLPVTKQPRTGDVWTFRYPSPRGREAGHCGVVIRQGFELVYLHNTAAEGGLHVDDARGFAALLERLNCGVDDVLWWRLAKD